MIYGRLEQRIESTHIGTNQNCYINLVIVLEPALHEYMSEKSMG
jgi:hypothetical protein